MKKIILGLAVAAAALTSCSNKGWTPLFINDSFEGWQSVFRDSFPEVGWSIKDGIVTSNPEGVRGGDIMTIKSYRDFELKGEFLLSPLSNSGVKYFINPGEMPNANIGCEFQIIDDKDFNDKVEALDENRLTGSLYDIITADKSKANFQPKEWNSFKIVVKGGHVEHWLNDVMVVEYDRYSPAFDEAVKDSKFAGMERFGKFETGHILIQDHDNSVQFRNMMIKEL